MLSTIPFILIILSVILLIVSMVIINDFERLGGICGALAIFLFIVAICIMAFTGSAPHIVDDQYMPISYP